jgi:hypothetical protein
VGHIAGVDFPSQSGVVEYQLPQEGTSDFVLLVLFCGYSQKGTIIHGFLRRPTRYRVVVLTLSKLDFDLDTVRTTSR